MKTDTLCRDLPCDHLVAERPRYYARQIITQDDLTLEQDYFRSKLRTHNRYLHGWGVVCGAKVCLVPRAEKNGSDYELWKVVVKPGYILGPYGDEINIDCKRVVDLRTGGVTGVTGEPCVEEIDPWCVEAPTKRENTWLYVAVRYKEVPARPVRVQPVGCGCDDTQCEYSRLRDGYEIKILTYCPDSHKNPPDKNKLFDGTVRECPPCPDEPWVVLAKVKLEAGGKVSEIDNCSCRRLVASFGDFWWRCRPDKDKPASEKFEVEAIEHKDRLQPGAEAEIIIRGKNLQTVERVRFGEGVTVKELQAKDAATLVTRVSIAADAEAGARKVEMWDRDGNKYEKEEAIKVEPPDKKPAPSPTASKKTSARKRSSSKKSEEEV